MANTGSKKRSSHWNWLLLLPGIGLLFPAAYARQSPTLFGFPFFYWYQFLWVFLTAAITAVVYVLVKDETSDPPPQNSGQQK
jgi:dolichyl-phosphate-mannose--protein O-mannosyl transferase